MTLETLVPIFIPSLFVVYLVIERVFPGKPQPEVRGWWAKGIAFFVLAFLLNGLVPALVVAATGESWGLGLTWLGTIGGGVAALLVGDIVSYWIHRTTHVVGGLWRWTHQMHHSAERMDMLGAVYTHPIDFVIGTVLPGTLVALGLGITAEAAAFGGMLGFALGVFPHLNVKTPTWFGYFLQRPEMHTLHHERGVHAYNYGSLAISDLLFGTWRNPKTFSTAPLGFWDGASRQTVAMLLGRDVGKP